MSDVSLRVPPEPKAPDGTVTQDLPLVALRLHPGQRFRHAGRDARRSRGARAEAAPLAAVAAGDFAVSFGSYASAGDADKVIAALAAAGLPGYREAVALAIAVPSACASGRSPIAPPPNRRACAPARCAATWTPRSWRWMPRPPRPAVPAAPAVTKPAPAEPKIEAKPLPKAEPVKVEPAKPATTPVAKPEPLPAKPANAAGTGFVVQIGAFSSAPDALAQRDALRKAGFNAFTDSVPGPNGTLTRVRVGPVMNRAEADALKAKLKAAGKDGMVRPHP